MFGRWKIWLVHMTYQHEIRQINLKATYDQNFKKTAKYREITMEVTAIYNHETVYTLKHIYSCVIQRHIQNPVKHLRWSVLRIAERCILEF